MQKFDNIIKQIKQGIKRQEMFIARENSETEEGCKNIEFYRSKIAELEYRISELEEKKKGNTSILRPEYGDGKYASDEYKEAFDMLRVCYYNYFHHDPIFIPVPKWSVMFYDPTLYLPVDTYLVKGKIPFQIMFSDNYPDHKFDSSKSISIELPFEVLSKKENEEYLRCMLELIKLYSGDGVNFVLGNGISTRGHLSYIAETDFFMYPSLSRDENYYEFFDRLCDNNIRNIIHIGDSMQKEVKSEAIEKVQKEIIDNDERLTAKASEVTDEELEQSNEKIKQRILSINSHL